MDLGLTGKRALVTGSGQGIGRAIAEELAAEGAAVCIVGRREEPLSNVKEIIESRGGRCEYVLADVSIELEAQRAVSEGIEKLGGLDILVNNVGGSLQTLGFNRTTSEQWRRVIDTNLMSAVWCAQPAVDHMTANGGGTIVHMNSICGRELCGSSAYTTAKAAMTGLTKEMAYTLAKHKIRVLGVAPGSIMFPGGSWDERRNNDPDLIMRMLTDELPWGRFGTVEEVSSVAVFLCSPRASWVTGTTVVVDGCQSHAF